MRWRALGRDGHVVAGVFTFGVRAKAPEATAAAASGPSGAENAARWLAFASLALVIGGLGFRLLVLRRPVPPRFERRFYLVTLAGAIGVVEVAFVAFLLRADAVLQLPLSTFLYGDLRPIVGTPVRDGVGGDDARVRPRDRADLPRLAHGAATALVAGVRDRRRLRLGLLALRSLGGGVERIALVAACGLGSPHGRLAVGWRRRHAARRLPDGPRACPPGVRRLRPPSTAADRAARRRRRVSLVPAACPSPPTCGRRATGRCSW